MIPSLSLEEFQSHVKVISGSIVHDTLLISVLQRNNNDTNDYIDPIPTEQQQLLVSIVRKCLRDATSSSSLLLERNILVSCYTLRALALVVNEEEMTVSILKLIYHLISIASTSSSSTSCCQQSLAKELTLYGFQSLKILLVKIIPSHYHNKEDSTKDSSSSSSSRPGRTRRRKKVQNSNHTIPSNVESDSSSIPLLPIPTTTTPPIEIPTTTSSSSMNFRQLGKLVIGSLLHVVSQLLLTNTNHKEDAMALLSFNAIPWIRALVLVHKTTDSQSEEEREKCLSEAIHSAQLCYRRIWDYSSSQATTNESILTLQQIAIQYLCLVIPENDENCNISTPPWYTFTEKLLDSTCQDVVKSLLSLTSSAQPQQHLLLISFHKTVGFLLDQQAEMLWTTMNIWTKMSYMEYCTIRALHLSPEPVTTNTGVHHPFMVFPFAASIIPDTYDCLPTTVLSIIYSYLSSKQDNESTSFLSTYCKHFQSLVSSLTSDNKLLYKCWKLFQHLNITRIASNAIAQISSSDTEESQNEKQYYLSAIAQVLNHCVAPLSLLLLISSLNTMKQQPTMLNSETTTSTNYSKLLTIVSTEENDETMICLQLLDILFTCSTTTSSPILENNPRVFLATATDAWVKSSMILDTIGEYTASNVCFLKAAAAACNSDALIGISKSIATIGRNRLKTNSSSMVLPLIMSCHFFSELLPQSSSLEEMKNLGVRYSCLASSLSTFCPEEDDATTIAYALSIRYHLLSTEDNNTMLTSDCIIDASTNLALLCQSSPLGDYASPVLSILDKLHRHVFRKSDIDATASNAEGDVVVQKALSCSHIGKFYFSHNKHQDNNIVSMLLAVLTSNNNISFPTILQMLRCCICFIGKEYQRQIWMTKTATSDPRIASTSSPSNHNIWKSFEESVTESISFINSNCSSESIKLLAKASIFLAAANSLIPKGYLQESNSSKAKKNDNMPQLKNLLCHAFAKAKNAFEILLILQDRRQSKKSMSTLVYLSSTSILLVELLERIDDADEPLLLPSEFCYGGFTENDPDCALEYILNLSTEAALLAITRKDTAEDEQPALQSLTKTLCLLHGRFYSTGSLVNAARAAYHAALLDNHEMTISCSVVALAGSIALVEGELYDSSYEYLLAASTFNQDLQEIEDEKTPVRISSLQDCIILGRIALTAALKAQCGLSEKKQRPIDILLSVLSITQEYSKMASALSEHVDVTVAVFASWIRTTCLLFVADLNEKSGDLVCALSALKECCAVCKENIKISRRANEQEKRIDSSQFHIVMASRWTGRLSSCLMSMAMCYARLGDRRRAEGYSVASTEILGLNTDEQDASNWLSCREKGALREFWLVKDLSSPSELNNDCSNLLSIQHGNNSFRNNEDIYSSVASIHWKIEFIRSLIYRGDKLKRNAKEGIDNGFSECFFCASQLLEPLLSVQCGSLINGEIGFNTSALKESRFDSRLGALDSAVKLRLARCIELKGEPELIVNGDAEQLYEDVRRSPFTNGVDRARSCYRLGRMFLERARRAGELSRLWKGHAAYVQLDDGESFTSNEKHGYISSNFVSRAVSFLREAKSYSGEATDKLSRHILRSLALALGPVTAPCTSSLAQCASEAALLIHLSVGGSSRQMVTRVYADGAEFLCSGDKRVKAAFEAFNTNMLGSKELLHSFIKTYSTLPHDWIVTALTLVPSGELLISSIQSNAEGGVDGRVRCIFPTIDSETDNYFRDILEQMDSILEVNRLQLSGMDSSAAEGFSKEATRNWWKDRKNIDHDLKCLVETVEKTCFYSCSITDVFSRKKNEQKVLQDIFHSNLLNAVECSENCISVRNKATCQDACEMEDNDIVHEQDLQKLTVVNLKEKLETEFGVEKSVTRRMKKIDLIDLLLLEQQRRRHGIRSSANLSSSCTSSMPAMNTDRTPSRCTSDEPPSVKRESSTPCLILVLDERLHRFPWENLPMFLKKQICRVPSLPFVIAPLAELGHKQRVVDPKNVSYLIDPESNLSSTRHKLEDAISQICLHQQPPLNWSGVVGQIPPLSFFQESLEKESGAFLYCGHGGGESCFSRSRVEEMMCNPKELSSRGAVSQNNTFRRCRSSVILMGCSSGRLTSGGSQGAEEQSASAYCFYEPEGIATWYLMAGAPCVIGNLWDVTDRDIDRYCIELLERFFVSNANGCVELDYQNNRNSNNTGSSLAQCVADARDACKMRYIVGCAPVCFGIPVSILRDSK